MTEKAKGDKNTKTKKAKPTHKFIPNTTVRIAMESVKDDIYLVKGKAIPPSTYAKIPEVCRRRIDLVPIENKDDGSKSANADAESGKDN